MTKKENGSFDWRLKELEDNYKALDAKIDLILTNHLPHLAQDNVALKTRMNLLTAINIGGIIMGVVAAKLLQ